MANADDVHNEDSIVDRVDDAVLPTPSRVQPRERRSERLSQPIGALGQRPEDELDTGRGDRLG